MAKRSSTRSMFAMTPEQVQAREERRIRSAGTHGDRRTKRNRTRGAQKRMAIRESW